MPSAQELESRLRDLVNAPRGLQALTRNRQQWNRVCSAMDVIGDTELAIDAYVEHPPEKASPGAVYLGVYGILQTLVVQQDALNTLAEELGLKFELPSQLSEIRSVRVASIGHPTDIRMGKDRHVAFISRPTLPWAGFELWVASDKGDERKYVAIQSLIDDQRRLIAELLERVIDHLVDEELQHRREYRHERLQDAFESHLLYAFEKLREGIANPAIASLAEWGLDVVAKSLAEFKNRLQTRGVDKGYAGVPPAIEAADEPLRRLRAYLAGETPLEMEDALVYATYLQHRVDELRQIAKEIDGEYSSDEV